MNKQSHLCEKNEVIQVCFLRLICFEPFVLVASARFCDLFGESGSTPFSRFTGVGSTRFSGFTVVDSTRFSGFTVVGSTGLSGLTVVSTCPSGFTVAASTRLSCFAATPAFFGEALTTDRCGFTGEWGGARTGIMTASPAVSSTTNGEENCVEPVSRECEIYGSQTPPPPTWHSSKLTVFSWKNWIQSLCRLLSASLSPFTSTNST